MASSKNDASAVVTALHVMSTERAALTHLEHLYQTDARAQQDLARAVDLIARTVRESGKLVVCGVGKSGKIGRKIEATMNSLGIYSAFLHPTEALHGDLGLVRPVSHPASRMFAFDGCIFGKSNLAKANSERCSLREDSSKRGYANCRAVIERYDASYLVFWSLARAALSAPIHSYDSPYHRSLVAYSARRMSLAFPAWSPRHGSSSTGAYPRRGGSFSWC
jgi:hypothetical protein